MNTQKDQAAGQGGPGSLFAAETSAVEELAPAEQEAEGQGPTAEEDETDLRGPDALQGEAGDEGEAEDDGEAEEEDDVAAGATAAAQVAVDAPAGGGGQTASASRPSTPLPPSSRVLSDEDEPYVFNDCTVTICIQLLPDDGDEDGREVIIGVSSHIEGPLLEMTRQRLLGQLPPPVAELVKLHADRLPGLGEARAEQRQRETTAKSSARSKTTVRGANGKTAASTSKPGAATAAAQPTTQSSLFDLNTGHRPKAADTTAAGAS